MANVTMELRTVMEIKPNLFNFDYPITDLSWKEKLEKKIIDHYFFHEICDESLDKWEHLFRTKMNAMMGYYDELYKTTLFENDPLTNQRLEETVENENTGNQQVEEENTGTQKIETDMDEETKGSDYPQSQNVTNDILSGHQRTDRGEDQTRTDDLKHKQTRTDDLKNKQQRIISGYFRMPYPELLQMHRDTILRIDSMIIAELKNLFIQVY